MTDRIDLDDRDDSTEEPADRPNRGDWLWKGEGDPDDERAPAGPDTGDEDGADAGAAPADRGDADGDGDGDSRQEGDGGAADPGRRRVPHVPRENKDKPVGIPIEGGGAGGGPGREGGARPGSPEEEAGGAGAEGSPEVDVDAVGDGPAPSTAEASGPHGRGADDMTTAFTYAAVTRLADPAHAVAAAAGWSDWIGIVGDVEAHVINKFQRDHNVDVDFFNGSGTGPGERLAEIDERSMFFAERMVLVGVEGEDEGVARTAGWEFVPLSTAAEKAGWELSA